MAMPHGSRGEDALLAVIDQYFSNIQPDASPGAILRGDDCAVISCPQQLLLSTDLFIEDAHFRTSYFSPEELGHKALAVNISDIAAMGGKPLGFSLGLGLPQSLSPDYFSGICKGMAALAEAHGIYLSGGDLSAAKRLTISITIWGAAWPENAPQASPFLQRGVAWKGDRIFCSGSIGLARAGLALLESKGREALQSFPLSCTAHLSPAPKIAEGRALASLAVNHQLVSRIGLMDISDGLARDLPRLVGAGKGASIKSKEVPVHPEAREAFSAQGLNPVRESLLGGEDYALAGTCPPEYAPLLNDALPGLAWIGEVTDAPGVFFE